MSVLYVSSSSAGVFHSSSFSFFFFISVQLLPKCMHGRFRQLFTMEMPECGVVFTELHPRVSLMDFVIIMGTGWSKGHILYAFIHQTVGFLHLRTFSN